MTPLPTGPMASTIRFCEAISEWTGRIIAWLTLLMVLVTFTVVVLRYGFNLGWIALQESVTYLHAMVFLLGAAYTLKHDGHVRVDIFYQEMGPRGKAWVNLLGTLFLLLPVCLFILYQSWGYVAESWRVHETSPDAGGIPFVYLLKTNILLLCLFMPIQGLALALRSVLVLQGRPLPQEVETEHASQEL